MDWDLVIVIIIIGLAIALGIAIKLIILWLAKKGVNKIKKSVDKKD